MSDKVRLSMETILPQASLLKKTRLFTDEQISKIMKRREDFEYKIRRPGTIDEYGPYIDFETKLLATIRTRLLAAKATNGGAHVTPSRAAQILTLSKSHIGRIWQERVHTHGRRDAAVCIAHCQWLFLHQRSSLPRALALLRARHPRTPEAYTLAAEHARRVEHDFTAARQALSAGMVLAPQGPLYASWVLLELCYCVSLGSRDAEVTEAAREAAAAGDKASAVLLGAVAKLVTTRALAVECPDGVSDYHGLRGRISLRRKLAETAYGFADSAPDASAAVLAVLREEWPVLAAGAAGEKICTERVRKEVDEMVEKTQDVLFNGGEVEMPVIDDDESYSDEIDFADDE